MTDAPLRYQPDLEDIKPDEQETIRDLCSTFDVILERTAEDYGHAVRSVHAKAHGVLTGELTVADGLPPAGWQGGEGRAPGRMHQRAFALASERVAPTRLASAAAMKSSSSPSSTASGLPFSTLVRRSFTSW